MVVHNPEHQQQWVRQRAEQQEQVRKRKKKKLRWSVVGVQSLACVALLLLAFVLKMAGGNVYAGLKQRFHNALTDNRLVTSLFKLFDEEGTDVKGVNFTDEETQQNSRVSPINTVAFVWWPYV